MNDFFSTSLFKNFFNTAFLSIDSSKISPLIEDDSDQELFDHLIPLIVFMQNLPLPLVAILNGQEEVVDALLEQGINFNTLPDKYPMPETATDYLGSVFPRSLSMTLNFDDKVFDQLFILALESKNLKAADLFLKFGIDLKKIYELSPQLYNAALKAGHYFIAKSCLDYKKLKEEEEYELQKQKARLKYLERAQQLINEGKDPGYFFPPLRVNNIFPFIDNAMDLAAEGGSVEIIQMLLTEGYSPNPRNLAILYSSSPIIEALKHGHIEAAQFLLDHGAQFDIELRDNESQRVFRQVAKYGDLKTLQFLYGLGCSMSYVNEDENVYDLLSLATESGNEDNIRFAKEIGFDLQKNVNLLLHPDWSSFFALSPVSPPENFKPLTLCQKIDLFVELGANLNETPHILLDSALYFGLEEEFDYLQQMGVKFSPSYLRYQERAIHLLASAISGKSTYLFDKLIQLGLDTGPLLSNYQASLDLMAIACEGSSSEIVQKLIDLGFDCHIIDDRDFSNALFWTNTYEVTELLIRQGLDVNHTDRNGDTPIFYANDQTMAALIKNGANIYHENNQGETALFNPNLSDQAKKQLIQKGLNLNHENYSGLTPLMKSSLNDDQEDVQDLLEAGADPTYKNSQGKTVIDLLLEANEEEIKEESFWTSFSRLKDLLQDLGYKKPSGD